MKIDWPKEISHLLHLLEANPPSVQESIKHIKRIQRQNDLLSGSNRVLIMDDNTDMLELIEEVLTGQGFEVFCSTHGDETLEILKSKPTIFFHAIILDLVVVGGRGGLSVLSEVTSLCPGITIILSSGHPTEFELVRENPTYALLHKPYRINELLQLLFIACNSSRERYYSLS
jgi:DNA-binding NtrC family response regulator